MQTEKLLYLDFKLDLLDRLESDQLVFPVVASRGQQLVTGHGAAVVGHVGRGAEGHVGGQAQGRRAWGEGKAIGTNVFSNNSQSSTFKAPWKMCISFQFSMVKASFRPSNKSGLRPPREENGNPITFLCLLVRYRPHCMRRQKNTTPQMIGINETLPFFSSTHRNPINSVQSEVPI